MARTVSDVEAACRSQKVLDKGGPEIRSEQLGSMKLVFEVIVMINVQHEAENYIIQIIKKMRRDMRVKSISVGSAGDSSDKQERVALLSCV